MDADQEEEEIRGGEQLLQIFGGCYNPRVAAEARPQLTKVSSSGGAVIVVIAYDYARAVIGHHRHQGSVSLEATRCSNSSMCLLSA